MSFIKHHILSLIQLTAISRMLFSLEMKGYCVLWFSQEKKEERDGSILCTVLE